MDMDPNLNRMFVQAEGDPLDAYLCRLLPVDEAFVERMASVDRAMQNPIVRYTLISMYPDPRSMSC